MSDACPVCGGKPIEEVKYISMCTTHQAEVRDVDARRAGIPDLLYNGASIKTEEGAAKLVADIRFRLNAYPEKSITIKVTK